MYCFSELYILLLSSLNNLTREYLVRQKYAEFCAGSFMCFVLLHEPNPILDFFTVHKLSSIKIKAKQGLKPGAAGWEGPMIPMC